MMLKTDDLRPSQVLRMQQYFGTYDRAVALAAVEYPVERGSEVFGVIADLYGVEIGQVEYDVAQARKREQHRKPTTSVHTVRTLGPGHPTGGRIRT